LPYSFPEAALILSGSYFDFLVSLVFKVSGVGCQEKMGFGSQVFGVRIDGSETSPGRMLNTET